MNNRKLLFFLMFSSFLNEALQLFLKFYSNNLNPLNANIFSFGNILQYSILCLTLLPLIYFLIKKEEIQKTHFRILAILFVVTIIINIPVLYFYTTDKNILYGYLFNYPTKKIVLTSLLVLNRFLTIYIMLVLWNLVFSSKFVLYLKSLFMGVVVCVLLVLLTFIYTGKEFEQEFEKDDNQVGVVLGAAVWKKNKPTPLFEGRIQKAKKLLTDRKIGNIFLTGGNAPGEVSEAEAALLYLRSTGVARYKVNFENQTSTTCEQIRYIKNELINRRTDIGVVFISDQFHLVRVYEMSKFFDIDSKVSASEYELSAKKNFYYRLRDSIGLLLFWFFAI